MLQIRYRFMSLSVLAIAALTLPATAASTCDLADGLPLDPAVFNQEVSACYDSQGDSKQDARLERQLIDATDRVRADQNKAALVPLASLEQAARIHAMDMAARDYAGHADPEGRSHLERVRMIDRTVLIGAAGANIAIVEGEHDAADLFGALRHDPVNADNMTRSAFTHTGIGVATGNGRTYIVQLFARVDGQLQAPLPVHISGNENIRATFEDKGLQPVAWRLTSPAGDTIARGYGSTMTGSLQPGQQAYLTLDIARNNTEFAIRGPIVTGQ
ncbi:MAG: hypothetical protein ACI9NG_002912 [Hyphomonas sp.]|jgi:uncharacterized protein YkwD